MSITVNLAPEFENIIRDRMASGRYASETQVVEEALRLLEHRDAAETGNLEALRREIAIGLADLDAGRAVDAETVFQEIAEIIAVRKET